jgi:hypothetical protein
MIRKLDNNVAIRYYILCGIRFLKSPFVDLDQTLIDAGGNYGAA